MIDFLTIGTYVLAFNPSANVMYELYNIQATIEISSRLPNWPVVLYYRHHLTQGKVVDNI